MSLLQRTSRTSPLVEALVSEEQRVGIGGMLVNDLNGFCLVSKGNMSQVAEKPQTSSGADNNDSNKSGVYTSLTRLASTLTPYQTASTNNENPTSPLLTIEMDGPASLIIKEYDGHTIAIKVPNKTVNSDD